MKDEETLKDLEFLYSLTPDQIDPYRGEWVAISNGRIVAHGKDPGRVVDEAWKSGAKSPLMERIYADQSEVPLFPTVL